MPFRFSRTLPLSRTEFVTVVRPPLRRRIVRTFAFSDNDDGTFTIDCASIVPAAVGFVSRPALRISFTPTNFTEGARPPGPGGSYGFRRQMTILAELNAPSSPIVASTYTGTPRVVPRTAKRSIQTAVCLPRAQVLSR